MPMVVILHEFHASCLFENLDDDKHHDDDEAKQRYPMIKSLTECACVFHRVHI